MTFLKITKEIWWVMTILSLVICVFYQFEDSVKNPLTKNKEFQFDHLCKKLQIWPWENAFSVHQKKKEIGWQGDNYFLSVCLFHFVTHPCYGVTETNIGLLSDQLSGDRWRCIDVQIVRLTDIQTHMMKYLPGQDIIWHQAIFIFCFIIKRFVTVATKANHHHAEIILGNLEIYLLFVWFLHTQMVQIQIQNLCTINNLLCQKVGLLWQVSCLMEEKDTVYST